MYAYTLERMEKIKRKYGAETILVSQYPKLRAAFGEEWTFIENKEPMLGISHSVRLALESVKAEKKENFFLFSVCDQPFLKAETLEKFLEHFFVSGKGIGCICHDGVPGNPVVFRDDYREELLNLTKDQGGKAVVKRHMEDVFLYETDEKELRDMDESPLVVVRGGGDLASGTIHLLFRKGYRVLVLETKNPACIRRQVSFCEAVYEGVQCVEDVTSVLCSTEEDIRKGWIEKKVPVVIDPLGEQIPKWEPEVIVDAILAKRNLGTRKGMAPLTIGLGPGFTAGKDVDAVIETMRGETLGKIFYKGSALPNTGIPGEIMGYSKERVIHAPAEGNIRYVRHIGDKVKKGDTLAFLGETEVTATMDGLLRGAIKEGYPVRKGLKIMDIEPRIEEKERLFRISDKATILAESVLQVIQTWEREQCIS